jgi:hypothetical protein
MLMALNDKLEQPADLSVHMRAPSRVDRVDGGMAMQFTRVVGPVEALEIWSASSDGFSFVISYESPGGPGFHGRTGFVASWRPIHQSSHAIKVGGSPFETLTEAEEACNAMLGNLTRKLDGE